MYIKRDSKYFLYLYAVDFISLIISFQLAIAFVFSGRAFLHDQYNAILIISILSNACCCEMIKNFDTYFDRGYLGELKSVFKQLLITACTVLICLFILKRTAVYSRLFLVLYASFSIVFTYAFRVVFKVVLKNMSSLSKEAGKVMIVTTSDRVNEVLNHVKKKKCWDYSFNSIAVIDKDMRGEMFGSKIINANADTMFEQAKSEVLDEVLVHIGYHNPMLQEIVDGFQSMGVTVHIVLNDLNFDMPNPKIERFSNFPVVTTCNNTISHTQMLSKRILDILGSLVGLTLTGLISLFVIPAIKLESKGPAIYSQTRVGRNGRKFKIYKFRSMYIDADERKAELMAKNKMDGFMFKMDDDPRITKVGKFIRKTSIDELPQFFNVLKGDMSLVGTRPPTVDEFEKYDMHHKNRLSFKPGLTGQWQVSGRSDITDFEEIVNLDTYYIDNWSLGSDISILFKTVFNVLIRKGAE